MVGAISLILLQPACGDGGPPPPTPETISTPSPPSGPSAGDINEVLTYTTGGSTSSKGYNVQYRFDWGDQEYSDWSSSPSAPHSWSSPGNYMVRAQARSFANPDITSSWSSGKSVAIKELSIPLNLRIDYIGARDTMGDDDYDEDPLYGEIQVVIVVTNGNNESRSYYIPQKTSQGFLTGFTGGIGSYTVKRINRHIYHTASAGDYLKLSILAYDIDSNTKIIKDAEIVAAIGTIAGVPEAKILPKLVSLLPVEDDRVGDYEATWHADENYGIGQHVASCLDKSANENFFVWFSIWSDEKPPLIPEPSLLPDVKIQGVEIPFEVVQSNTGWFYYRWYSNTLVLTNNEPVDVKVDWKVYSSAKGEFDQGTAIVPANGKCDIRRSYFYENDVGPVELTYYVFHNGKELDSWSGTTNVIPGPYS